MQSVISMKLQSNFIQITLRHGCSLVNLLHFFRTPLSKNTSGWLLPKCHILELHQSKYDKFLSTSIFQKRMHMLK